MSTILFLHGWNSVPGGVKPTYLKDHGHTVINPRLPDDDFAGAVRIAQAEFDKHQPQVVVGSSRGGAVAMNIASGEAKLVLLCPAWKKYGTARTLKAGTVILHSRADEVIPFGDSEELVRHSGLPVAALIEVGNDHRLATPEPLGAMLRACSRSEKEKMLAGELYDALDGELVRDRERARDLCQDLNGTREKDQEARRRILVELFGKGGDSVWMQPPFYCDYGSNILLGERVFFNFNCVILDVCLVKIGDFTLFGPAVQIYTASHPMDAQLRRHQEFGRPIEIGSSVWVGGGAIICPGVKIGSKSVIGAGSVVTRDIPEGVFAAGNPCRVVREITMGINNQSEDSGIAGTAVVDD